MGQVTFSLKDRPVLVARAETLYAPAELVFTDLSAIPGVSLTSGMSLELVIIRLTSAARKAGLKLTRQTEGVIRPVFA